MLLYWLTMKKYLRFNHYLRYTQISHVIQSVSIYHLTYKPSIGFQLHTMEWFDHPHLIKPGFGRFIYIVHMYTFLFQNNQRLSSLTKLWPFKNFQNAFSPKWMPNTTHTSVTLCQDRCQCQFLETTIQHAVKIKSADNEISVSMLQSTSTTRFSLL